jgi:signal transduction histidine kinase
MKSKLFYLTIFLCLNIFCKAQDTTVVLDTSMFNNFLRNIDLSDFNGWIYKKGNDTNWSKTNIETEDWKKFDPLKISAKDADVNGRFEAWLRFKFRPNSSFKNFPIGVFTIRFAATDIYIDGKYLCSFGSTGLKGQPYREFIGTTIPVQIANPLDANVDHILAVHVVDYRSPTNYLHLKTEENGWLGYRSLVNLTCFNTTNAFNDYFQQFKSYFTFWASVCGVLSALFWLLYFQNRNEKNLLVIATGASLFGAFILLVNLSQGFYLSHLYNTILNLTWYFLCGAAFASIIITLAKIFRRRISLLLIVYCICVSLSVPVGNYFLNSTYFLLVFLSSASCICFYLIITSWRYLKGAQWSIVAGILSAFIFCLLYLYFLQKYKGFPYPHVYLYLTGTFLSYPLSLMVYVAWRFKEILNEVRNNANEVVRVSEEKKEILANQNALLEQQVAARTEELHKSLQELKSTQAQLIQSEKMASLGELTAGIAHEIQNPLNFVNNFSDVNTELITELEEEVEKGNIEEIKLIAKDIKENEQKINHHGKRADSIVKGMLQHSKTSAGQKELSDINKLADEYLRLSYHGFRARDKSFNAEMQTDFDESIEKINVVPQDIGRVLLNLYNNAFYAINEKQKNSPLTTHN